MTPPQIEIRVPARLEYVGLLRDGALALGSVLAAGGRNVLPETVRKWALAVYEAGTNVVRHSYGGGSNDLIALSIEIHGDHAVFSLMDAGRPNLTFHHATPPKADAEGGYGLLIIRKVMQEVSYRRDAKGRNELRLVARFAEVSGAT